MRKIIHIDMDCFYAAIEMRDDPRLRDIPLAIGGSSDRRDCDRQLSGAALRGAQRDVNGKSTAAMSASESDPWADGAV